jgi:hypothetical protein
MKFEIVKETRKNDIWYHIYKDNKWEKVFMDYGDAKKYIEDTIYDIQHPPIIETIETIEI